MESRHKRSRSQLLKWVCYALLALLCAVLQTTPGLFQLDAAKPLYLLPLALELMLLCFAVSAVVQLYFKNTVFNFTVIATAAGLAVLTLDWLFFYYMPGYSGAVERYLWFVLPTTVLTVPVSFPLFWAVRRVHAEFKIDNGVV